MSGTVNMSPPGVQTPSTPACSARTGLPFPRANKLLKHALFDQVYQLGQRHFSGLMTVFFVRRESSPEHASRGGSRIGLTVGRVLGNSVARNRIRRRMREAVRLNLHLLAGPVDVVINPKKAVLTAEFSRIAEEVRKAFEAVARRIETDSCRDGSSARLDGAQTRPHTRNRRSGGRKQVQQEKRALDTRQAKEGGKP